MVNGDGGNGGGDGNRSDNVNGGGGVRADSCSGGSFVPYKSPNNQMGCGRGGGNGGGGRNWWWQWW